MIRLNVLFHAKEKEKSMSQQVRLRTQQQIAYVAGTKQIVQLGRGMIYRELAINITGQLTCSAANNTIANTQLGDEFGVIQRVDLVANGNDVLRSFSGNQLWWWNRALYNGTPPITFALGDGTTLNPTFNSTLIIPMWLPNSVRPFEYALDSRILADLRLEVTFGNHLNVNSAATGFTVAPIVTVGSLESFGVEGKFNGTKIYPLVFNVAGATQAYQVTLPVGPMYRSILINTQNVAGTADLATTLQNIRLRSGTTIFRDFPATMLNQWQQTRMATSFAYGTGAGATYHSPRRATGSNQNAWYYLDMVQDGYNGESIDTIGFSELTLELQLAAATTLWVMPLQITPIRA